MLDLTPYATPAARTLFAIEIGGLRMALTRAGAPSTASSRPFAWGALAGLGAATLALAGASATPQPVALRPVVTQLVPDLQPRRLATPRPRPIPGRAHKAAARHATGPFDAADAPYVARALATGAMQEWEDADGQRRFLTAGPARVEGGRTCRDMALLVRLADGDSRVRSAAPCTTAPVSDAPADPVVPPQTASGGADQ